MPRLAALTDKTVPLELRIRSYLDANCASCHRPGGPSRGNFDARFVTSLAAQNLVEGEPVAGDLGISGARVLAPGHPEKSLLLLRPERHDAFRMPPVAVNDDPQPLIEPLREWIGTLKPGTIPR
jgi:hypothetical protein